MQDTKQVPFAIPAPIVGTALKHAFEVTSVMSKTGTWDVAQVPRTIILAAHGNLPAQLRQRLEPVMAPAWLTRQGSALADVINFSLFQPGLLAPAR
jgi:hypothetical protein